MRKLSVGKIAVIVVLLAFVALFPLWLLTTDFEIPKPEGWADNLQMMVNAITQNIRVYDTESKTTIFWSSGNPPVQPLKVEKIGHNRWVVTFEQPPPVEQK